MIKRVFSFQIITFYKQIKVTAKIPYQGNRGNFQQSMITNKDRKGLKQTLLLNSLIPSQIN